MLFRASSSDLTKKQGSVEYSSSETSLPQDDEIYDVIDDGITAESSADSTAADNRRSSTVTRVSLPPPPTPTINHDDYTRLIHVPSADSVAQVNEPAYEVPADTEEAVISPTDDDAPNTNSPEKRHGGFMNMHCVAVHRNGSLDLYCVPSKNVPKDGSMDREGGTNVELVIPMAQMENAQDGGFDMSHMSGCLKLNQAPSTETVVEVNETGFDDRDESASIVVAPRSGHGLGNGLDTDGYLMLHPSPTIVRKADAAENEILAESSL